jgi:hypothetical protein
MDSKLYLETGHLKFCFLQLALLFVTPCSLFCGFVRFEQKCFLNLQGHSDSEDVHHIFI